MEFNMENNSHNINQDNRDNAKSLVANGGGTNYQADVINHVVNQWSSNERKDIEALKDKENRIKQDYNRQEKELKEEKEKEEKQIINKFKAEIDNNKQTKKTKIEKQVEGLVNRLLSLSKDLEENYYYEDVKNAIKQLGELQNIVETWHLPKKIDEKIKYCLSEGLDDKIQNDIKEFLGEYYHGIEDTLLTYDENNINNRKQKELQKCSLDYDKKENDLKNKKDNEIEEVRKKKNRIYRQESRKRIKDYPLEDPSNQGDELFAIQCYLGIEEEDAIKIQNQFLEPRKKIKVDEYQQKFQCIVEKEYPLSSENRQLLDKIQAKLLLTDEDVKDIEKEIENEAYQKNLNQYEEEFQQKIEQEGYPLSPETRAALQESQQYLGLKYEDVKDIERLIEQQAYQENLSQYQKEFQQKIEQESYPLSPESLAELQKSQQSLGLKDEDVKSVEEPIEQKAYQENLSQYKEEFQQKIEEEGYPLSPETRAALQESQQCLGLECEDVRYVEEPIEQEAYQENLSEYKEEFQQKIEEEGYPLSPESRAELQKRQQSLGLKDQDIRYVEEAIEKNAYQDNLEQYGTEFWVTIDEKGYPLSDEIRDSLKSRQKLLGLKNEDIKLIERLIQKFRNIDASPIFRNEQKIDYWELRDLLVANKWEKADDWTRSAIVRVAGREQEGYLDKTSIKNFPDIDLFIIDQLWVIYSKGRFGFSVQKKIFDSVGNSKKTFAKKVGWKKSTGFLSPWKVYRELTFGLDAPEGHLPAWAIKSNILEVNNIIRKNSDSSKNNIFGDDFVYLFSSFGEGRLDY